MINVGSIIYKTKKRRILHNTPCPLEHTHTKTPISYTGRHWFATVISKTHKQIICKGCGKYEIWVRKNNKPLAVELRHLDYIDNDD